MFLEQWGNEQFGSRNDVTRLELKSKLKLQNQSESCCSEWKNRSVQEYKRLEEDVFGGQC